MDYGRDEQRITDATNNANASTQPLWITDAKDEGYGSIQQLRQHQHPTLSHINANSTANDYQNASTTHCHPRLCTPAQPSQPS